MAVFHFFRTNPGIHITLPDMRPDRSIAKRIYAVGVPSGLMTAMPSLLVGILNALLVELHALAVAAFGLYFKLQTFVYMPANGLIQGMRPLISYNYGAGRQDRMRHIIRWSLILTAVIMAAGTLLAWLLPTQIMGLFDADRALIAVGVPMLRITSLAFSLTLGTVLAGCFEALGKGLRSLAVSCIRQLIIILRWPLFSRFWGLNGAWQLFRS
ncbi:MAG: MATE family efflux transporter [Evtepia gabavorous]